MRDRYMRVLLRLLAVVFLAVGAHAVVPVPVACACSCAPLDTRQALAGATAVFEADVLGWKRAPTGSHGDPISYTVAVTRVYKGEVPSRVEVISEGSEAACGVELTGRVTVFARDRAGELTTNLCAAPWPLDRTKLGIGRTPVPATPDQVTPSPSPSPTRAPSAAESLPPLVLWGMAGLVAMAAVITWLFRRAGS